MNRQIAYSFLEVKAIDDDQRIITGIASTPQTDRQGDIVEPLGAKFMAEVPLLWMHKHDKPVGAAKFGKATKAGIPFTANIAKISEDGELKNLVDYAWHAVKSKLVKAVSIGFLPKEYEVIKGGIRYIQSEIYELSLCTVPVNAGATIQTIKALSGYRNDSGAISLMHLAADQPRVLNGAVPLISAKRLASLPLKASR